MKIFIFKELEMMSFNYHSSGGVVIVAHDIKEARKIAEKEINTRKGFLKESQADIKIPMEAEYVEYPLVGEFPAEVYLFPDAGCC